MAKEHRTPSEEHPDPRTLLAYHEGSLTETEGDQVQEHLVRCPECTRLVLDLAAFPDLEPVTEADRLSSADVESRWRSLQALLDEPRSARWLRHQVLLPLAATFLVAAVGLGVWNARLRERVAELEAPRSDIYVVADLVPTTEVSRGQEEVVTVPPWAGRLVVLLNLRSASEYPRYQLRLEDGTGRVRLQEMDLHRAPEGNFALEISPRWLTPGENRLQVFGVSRGGRHSLAEFSLRLGP